jgi:thiamine pyrophosphate-dependent acetolactate synthase large subunit-like protein
LTKDQIDIQKPQDVDLPELETPVLREWGSDYLAEVIRDLDLQYIALNPGASFRGLHDSLVNHLGNRNPQMLLCLHEEHAVSIAHGYAKVTGQPMGAFVHSNVGLMHATAAIFNAWCDRVPLMVFGATGTVDAATRRPWIEWIHTAQDQGALVRDYTKWDAQPASVPAAAEALYRARLIATTLPCAPVYVNFPNDLQETRVSQDLVLPKRADFAAPKTGVPAAADLEVLVQQLQTARNPIFLMGRVNRDAESWSRRVALAERMQARVLTDLRVGAAFPTDHPLHAAKPVLLFAGTGADALRAADLVISLDWIDLAGAISAAWGKVPTPPIVHISLDQHVHRGWSMDHQGLPKTMIHLLADPDQSVAMLLERTSGWTAPAAVWSNAPAVSAFEPQSPPQDSTLTVRDLARCLRVALQPHKPSLIRLPLGWSAEHYPFLDPLDYLGSDGGGTIGAGPGMAVGAALALRDHHPNRLPVAVLGDGDFMMGNQAIWTAVRYGIPLLVVVCNNRSFFNDEIHQERVALQRNRPVQNKRIGMHIGGPLLDLVAIGRAQGAYGIGPVTTGVALREALQDGIARVAMGQVVLIDAHVEPGYDSAVANVLKDSNK